MVVRLPCNSEGLQKAVALLKQGELVAFPTETVYGLGADATQLNAIQKIFEAKSRPKHQALSVLISSPADLDDWARFVPPVAHRLVKQFWPGPLTLILPAASHVASDITGGTDNVGLRISAHPVVQALLKRFQKALVAPSANITGNLSPTRSDHVIQQLGDYIPLLLEGGPCPLGWESTIVDLSTEIPYIRREGVITHAQIQAICPNVQVAHSTFSALSTKNRMTIQQGSYADLIAQVSVSYPLSIAVLAYHRAPAEITLGTHLHWIRMPTDVLHYQRKFYTQLHRVQQQGVSALWIETPPQASAWDSVRAKLVKLCHEYR